MSEGNGQRTTQIVSYIAAGLGIIALALNLYRDVGASSATVAAIDKQLGGYAGTATVSALAERLGTLERGGSAAVQDLRERTARLERAEADDDKRLDRLAARLDRTEAEIHDHEKQDRAIGVACKATGGTEH